MYFDTCRMIYTPTFCIAKTLTVHKTTDAGANIRQTVANIVGVQLTAFSDEIISATNAEIIEGSSNLYDNDVSTWFRTPVTSIVVRTSIGVLPKKHDKAERVSSKDTKPLSGATRRPQSRTAYVRAIT